MRLKEELQSLIILWDWLGLFYFALVNGLYLWMAWWGLKEIRLRKRLRRVYSFRRVVKGYGELPVSIICPAFNEGMNIVQSVKSLLGVKLPHIEVVVVNDGSTDDTLEKMKGAFDLQPTERPYLPQIPTRAVRGIYISRLHVNLIVIDKENGGKADAINCGLNIAAGPLVCVIDADSIIDSEALAKLREEFWRDGTLVAAGGLVLPANDSLFEDGKLKELRFPKRFLPRMQLLEYLRAFVVGRVAWSRSNTLLIISGAFGLFHKETVLRCGGYRTDTVGEDMELIVRMHRILTDEGKPYSIRFVPEAFCWTEVPETPAFLSRQRSRWHRGLIDSLRFHMRMFFNPRYKAVGLLAFPYFLFVEALGPIIELSGYLAVFVSLLLRWINWIFFLLFTSLAFLLGTAISLVAIRIGEDLYFRYPDSSATLKLIGCAVLDNIFYRPLTSIWRVNGLWQYIKGFKGWGSMGRKGFS